MLQLRGRGAMRAGSVVALASTADRRLSQDWSRHFHAPYPQIDGCPTAVRTTRKPPWLSMNVQNMLCTAKWNDSWITSTCVAASSKSPVTTPWKHRQPTRVPLTNSYLHSVAMSETTLSATYLEPDELLVIAKQAVANACDIDLEDVHVDEDGVITYGMPDSSAGIIIAAIAEPAALMFQSLLLRDVEETSRLYVLLNEINVDLPIGSVFFEEGEIILQYLLIADRPHPDTVQDILGCLLEVADDYDDKLKSQLGGVRYVEKAEDEVEI